MTRIVREVRPAQQKSNRFRGGTDSDREVFHSELDEIVIDLINQNVPPLAPVSWGTIQGTLSNQVDLQVALDAKYDDSNPAGYIDSSALTPLNNDITILKNNELKILYFQTINSTSGTIAIPTGATIILNDFPQGLDAVAETYINGEPSGISPRTAGNIPVTVSSFDTSGNYILSGTPTSFPIAILFILKTKATNYSNLIFDNIIEAQNLDGATISYVDSQISTRQPLDSTLTSLATLDSIVGLIVETATDTFTKRVIAGTTNNIDIVNGNGVSGNPTIDLANVGIAGTYGSSMQIAVFTTDSKGRIISVTNTTINISSSNISDFIEAAQDAVGNILTDSATIDFTYNDASNTITAIVIDGSITNSKLATIPTQTFKGRTTAGTGAPEDLTKIQAQGILGLAISTTDKAISRYNGTIGNTQNSNVIVTDEGSIIFPSVSLPAYGNGKLVYDTENRTLTFFNADSGVSMQIGKEGWITFYNNSGSTIANGKPVYPTGFDLTSGWLTIGLADASDPSKCVPIGLTTETILNNSVGEVTHWGDVHGIDTSAFAPAALLFLGVGLGILTTTAPNAPNYRYRIGRVGRSHATLGFIQVTPSTASLGNGLVGQTPFINGTGNQEYKTALTIGKGLQLINRNYGS